MIGLGVGIDYALFLVTRFRDGYRQSNDTNTAIELAMNTAGRSVLFAGATVVIAILGLFIVGVQFLYGVALATSFTVVLVLAATLTLLPAMLSLTGKRVAGSRRARRRESRGAQAENRAWLRWVAAIQRRPALWALASTAVLLVLAAPLVGLRLAASDAANDAPSTTTYQAYQLLSNGFGPGFNGPLSLAVQLPKPARNTTTLTRLTAALAATPGIASVSEPLLDPAGTTAEITVYPTTAPDSKSTYDLVKHLRSAIIPPVAQATGAVVYLGGFTASQVDFAHVLSSKLPYFIGIVIALSALLLLIVFRSLLIPVQAAVMNVLSIAAALGVVQAMFERGWGASLLGITRSPIQAFLPVIAFAIIFGLSMDYEVFLVSRVHEEWIHGADHTTAVRNGIARTGRVITAAAAVMIVVFGSFAASNNHILELFGLTLAVAVFLDAIVIRTILLPATLQLFGPKTWALPPGSTGASPDSRSNHRPSTSKTDARPRSPPKKATSRTQHEHPACQPSADRTCAQPALPPSRGLRGTVGHADPHPQHVACSPRIRGSPRLARDQHLPGGRRRGVPDRRPRPEYTSISTAALHQRGDRFPGCNRDSCPRRGSRD